MKTPWRTVVVAVLALSSVTAAPAGGAATARPAATWRLLPSPATFASPVTILRNGSVVGNDGAADAPTQPWVWSPRTGRHELDRAGAGSAVALAASEHGGVVGRIGPTTSRPNSSAVRWVAGRARLLEPDVPFLTEATAVNDAGDTLVTRYTDSLPILVDLVTRRGGRTVLMPDVSGFQSGRSLNARRQAVVQVLFGYHDGQLYTWGRGVATRLPGFFVPAYGLRGCSAGITDSGYLAWSGVDNTGDSPHLRVWLTRHGAAVPLADTGTGNAEVACGGHAVTSRGHVVGSLTASPQDVARAVLWRDGRLVRLGTLADGAPSQAIAVNERDVVLAQSTVDGVATPFVWAAGRRFRLPVPTGYQRVTAVGLDDRGQVVGTAQQVSAEGAVVGERPVIWTPIPGAGWSFSATGP